MAWKTDRYDQFRAAYHKLTKKDQKLKEAVDKKMRRIAEDPLMGDPKTGAMIGLRSDHVLDHWVIVWELRPVIVNRKFLAQLQELWFYDLYHHP